MSIRNEALLIRNPIAVMSGLRERDVLVRAGGALGSETPAPRVTYGLPEENRHNLTFRPQGVEFEILQAVTQSQRHAFHTLTCLGILLNKT